MKYIFRIMLFVGLTSFLACADDYTEAQPTQTFALEDLQESCLLNPQVCEGFLNGLYRTMYTTGSGGTNLRHDDFGQKSWDIYMDMLSHDMTLGGNNYGWYSYICNLTDTENFASNSSYMPWRYYYRIIRGANSLIGGYDFDNLPVEQDSRNVLGQGLALRAYQYFNLMHLYVNDISNPSAPAIPLKTDTAPEAEGLSTVGEVFGQIIADLELAVSIMDNQRGGNKRKINKDVANGLLAYAYAAVGRNAEAAAAAKAVMDGSNFPLLTASDLVYSSATNSGGGFNDVNTPGWMWGQDLTIEMGLDLVSWWGQVDAFTYSYAWAGDPKIIDNDLFAAIPSNDIRKGQFTGLGNKQPRNKFFDPNRVSGGQRSVTTDYIYMRIEEMYLLYAEAAAKSGAEGGEAGARQALRQLMNIRLPDASYVDGLSGSALLDEIRLQTRIEFWGEGVSYFSYKRNQETRTRAANHLWFPGQSFQHNDPRLTLDIPQAEVVNNPNM
ncbi:MAG: RagB/SusD family nutrient uptake outer membrane protein [Flavobacteriaceae bacterium]|nr:RagB/SusD family nutrient uptake outer membrane protein [Flavobacteriaceae bacterium]